MLLHYICCLAAMQLLEDAIPVSTPVLSALPKSVTNQYGK